MKHYVKVFGPLFIFSVLIGSAEAQTRTKIKTTATTSKFIEHNFGSPSSVTGITDIADSNLAYGSVKSLLDKHVILTYDDNTFRGNEPLRRGDFIVALNSSLDAIQKVKDENNADASSNTSSSSGVNNPVNGTANNTTGIANNPAANAATGTTGGFTDLQQSSIYYPAAHALMEKGITAPFALAKSKSFNPGAPVTEGEVYDILNQVFGYDKSGMNPYTTYMSRNKFAMVLNNAVSNKLQQEYALIDQKNAQAEQLKQQEKEKLANEMKQQEQMRKDSLNNAYKAEQMEIEKNAAEKDSKKKHKK